VLYTLAATYGSGDDMGRHIFMIDNEPYFRFSTELALKKNGYLVSQTADGKDALERLLGDGEQRFRPDLILLDLELPGFPGIEIMRKLHEEKVAVPVMVVSGYFNAELYEELMSLGCRKILFKPVSEQVLLKRIEGVLTLQ
jgi:DNA-binding response OmpR family regulator